MTSISQKLIEAKGLISTTDTGGPKRWSRAATFEDYDGAPDSDHPIGIGATDAEAIRDLFEQQYEREA